MASVSHRDNDGSVSLGVASYSGAGSPENSITAAVGSIYRRTDGASGTTLYLKESGAGNTGWVAMKTATGAEASITSVEAAATALTTRVSATETAATALTTRVGTAETNITSLQSATKQYWYHSQIPGTGSGNAVMDFCGRTADINNSPMISPVAGTITAIRVGATGTASAPVSGTLAFRVDLNNVSGTTVHTLTFPTVAGSSACSIAVAAGDKVRIYLTKASVPTDGGVFIAWLTFAPS